MLPYHLGAKYDDNDATTTKAEPTVFNQQQQQFFQQFAPQVDAGVSRERPAHVWEIRLPEFIKFALPFTRKSYNPIVGETQVNEIEKAFATCELKDQRCHQQSIN